MFDLPGLHPFHLGGCTLQFGDELSPNFPPSTAGHFANSLGIHHLFVSTPSAQGVEWHGRLSFQEDCLQFKFCLAEFAPGGLNFSGFKP